MKVKTYVCPVCKNTVKVKSLPKGARCKVCKKAELEEGTW